MLNAGKQVLLANKEALVMSGALFMEAVAEGGGTLLPIDSEHSAIFQCLEGHRSDEVAELLLDGFVAALEAVFEDIHHGAQGHGPLLDGGKRVSGGTRATTTTTDQGDLQSVVLCGVHMRQDNSSQGGGGGNGSGGFDEMATGRHWIVGI
jgi:hypothetical protein